MDLLLPVFQLIYFIIHFLCSLGQAVLDCFFELYFLLCHLRRKTHFLPDSKRVIADAVHLKKIPRHLGLILNGSQTNNFKNICYLLNWCSGFGINNISLYDFDGLLKLKLPTLLANINGICTNLNVKVVVDDQIYQTKSDIFLSNYEQLPLKKCKVKTTHFSNVNTNKSNSVEGSDNMKSHKIILYIFSVDDGKDDIVQLVRKASQKEKIILNKDYIKDNLATNYIIDPDLVLIFGRPICTMGFLPWQIRLTEFLSIPSVSRLDYYEFQKLLKIYSKCEQRLGS